MSSTEAIAAGASAEAIQHHYDVGNAFYRLWLDPRLLYSCALYEEGDDLERAQVRKLDYHIRESGAAGKDRVLDIGCGWGALLNRMVSAHGVREAVGLTLSQEQADYVRATARPEVEVRLEPWQEHKPEAPYDAIVSVGAFEHFADLEQTPEEKIEGYRHFFRTCHRFLKPGGKISLQTMAYGDMPRDRKHSDLFIAEEIFPESDLPRLADIALASEGIFQIELVHNHNQMYARSMREWFDNLRAKRDEAVALVGEDIVKRYERYLRTFSYSFELGAFLLYRITLRRLDRAQLT
ncbi:MAG: cyclopropane-fatty-acyl-phospholipid synthase [Candidatus Eremiobacteraeota bacterium]|jgi:cyclopropane-fatty-acyl-phospholipid synthase|nr:cyclopropane-fatty-acyl-phospholipid synthase [Candidatus Eremiobacteraeota bacterium]